MNEIVMFYKFFYESNEYKLPMMLLYGPEGSGTTQLVESFCALQSLHLFKVVFSWLILQNGSSYLDIFH